MQEFFDKIEVAGRMRRKLLMTCLKKLTYQAFLWSLGVGGWVRTGSPHRNNLNISASSSCPFFVAHRCRIHKWHFDDSKMTFHWKFFKPRPCPNKGVYLNFGVPEMSEFTKPPGSYEFCGFSFREDQEKAVNFGSILGRDQGLVNNCSAAAGRAPNWTGHALISSYFRVREKCPDNPYPLK